MAKRTTLPATGRSHTDILAELRDMKGADVDWKNGRAPLYVFKATDEAYEVGRAAFMEYFSENALGARRAFPSVKRMEDEIVDIALDLFHAPDGAQGFMTTGGTESIILAMQTCRDWSRAKRGDAKHRGNVVGAETLHPAFNKGGKLMDLEVRRAPVTGDLRMDLAAVEALIDDDTIMIVGSAPNFPFGMIDPIRELGNIAERRGVWLHVDACVGGYLAPFVKKAGRKVPDFDFVVPAVSSLSADLHKFGFCPKPASTVFYRDADKAKHHAFDADVWPNGRFLTSTIVGTRPAGGVAGAWATLQFLGTGRLHARRREADGLRRRLPDGHPLNRGIEDPRRARSVHRLVRLRRARHLPRGRADEREGLACRPHAEAEGHPSHDVDVSRAGAGRISRRPARRDRRRPPGAACTGRNSGDVLSQPTEDRASHFIIAWASERSAWRAGSRE